MQPTMSIQCLVFVVTVNMYKPTAIYAYTAEIQYLQKMAEQLW